MIEVARHTKECKKQNSRISVTFRAPCLVSGGGSFNMDNNSYMLNIRNFWKMPKPQGRSPILPTIGSCLIVSNSVSVRSLLTGSGPCRIIGLYRELRHLCRGKLILLRWEEFLDQIEECLQVSGDLYQLESIVTCSFHCYLILQA